MNKKKIVFVGVIIVAMLGFFSINALAANAWYAGCEVTRVGPSSGDVLVELSHKSFGKKWFVAQTSKNKEVLAVALTAMTNRGTVLVFTDPAGPRIIYNFYLQ